MKLFFALFHNYSYYILGGDRMLKSFILCLFSIFSVYGFICFLLEFRKERGIHIIKTLNDENSIEAKLRLAMLRYDEIWVFDLGSSDDTLEIVKKMMSDYKTIKLLK